MASLSAIAQGDSVVTADQINYQQKMFSHPSYKFEPQFPNTFGQSISLVVHKVHQQSIYPQKFLIWHNHF